MADFSWNVAVRVCGLNVTAAERDAGWPESLTLDRLAELQYPAVGTNAEKRTARQRRNALLETMEQAIGSAALAAELRSKIVPVFAAKTAQNEEYPPSGLGSQCWNAEFRKTRTVLMKTGEREEKFQVITRTAFSAWVERNGITPSEHVRAWFSSVNAPDEKNGAATDHGKNDTVSLTPMGRKAIIATLERYYPSLKSDFNRMEGWIKDCGTGKRGQYYLEKIKEGCVRKWGVVSPSAPLATVRTHKLAG